MIATSAKHGCAPITLDHVGFVGADLKRMSETFRRIGFAPTQARTLMRQDPFTGQAQSLNQFSCHLIFETGYVELSALSTQDPGHHLSSYAGRYEGLHILAFGTSDIYAAAERVRSAGIPIIEPAVASRDVTYGTRAGTAKFLWFMLQPAAAPDALICFVQHLTPTIVFQPEVQTHPNTAVALREVTIVTPDPQITAQLITKATGGPVQARPDGWRIALSGSQLKVCDDQQFSRRFPGTHIQIPSVAAICIEVGNLPRAVEVSRSGGARAHAEPELAWIEPQSAVGAVIEFTERPNVAGGPFP